MVSLNALYIPKRKRALCSAKALSIFRTITRIDERESIPGAVFDRAMASEQSSRSSAARQILACVVVARLLTNSAQHLNTSAELRKYDIIRSAISRYASPPVAPYYIKERVHQNATADAPG
jgi:hypothetical protein